MKCNICDSTLHTITYCPHTGKIEPCTTCIQASSEVDIDSGEILTSDDTTDLLQSSPICE